MITDFFSLGFSVRLDDSALVSMALFWFLVLDGWMDGWRDGWMNG